MPKHSTSSETCLSFYEFDYIAGFQKIRNGTLVKDGFVPEINSSFCFFLISEGKFEWHINGKSFVALPNDLVVVLPGVIFGNEEGILETGCFYKLSVKVEYNLEREQYIPGAWSGLSLSDFKIICKLLELRSPLVIPDFKKASDIFQQLIFEINSGEIGYKTRVNALIDELFVRSSRSVSQENAQSHDFPKVFVKLDTLLRDNLSHPWSVGEMAGVVGYGVTSFTEKIRHYSGFSPLNYLINLRIAEAIRLLKNTDFSMTKIALDTGFYSSQHFSSTFKKITGYSPKIYRQTEI